jgi:3-isopropylmalate/(R)-2-methylmalate dehydratase small subunit
MYTFHSTAVLLVADDVDTDQIIPARFLKVTGRDGLGDALFADWRYDADGRTRADFPLNAPNARSARVLVAGRNFGCGSSREHAAWAIVGFGFRAVVATSFADIFRANALKNGLLPVALPADGYAQLIAMLRRDAETRLGIDLATMSLSLPDGSTWRFPIDPFARRCLLDGVDQLGYLLAADSEIASFERHHGQSVTTR